MFLVRYLTSSDQMIKWTCDLVSGAPQPKSPLRQVWCLQVLWKSCFYFIMWHHMTTWSKGIWLGKWEPLTLSYYPTEFGGCRSGGSKDIKFWIFHVTQQGKIFQKCIHRFQTLIKCPILISVSVNAAEIIIWSTKQRMPGKRKLLKEVSKLEILSENTLNFLDKYKTSSVLTFISLFSVNLTFPSFNLSMFTKVDGNEDRKEF